MILIVVVKLRQLINMLKIQRVIVKGNTFRSPFSANNVLPVNSSFQPNSVYNSSVRQLQVYVDFISCKEQAF